MYVVLDVLLLLFKVGVYCCLDWFNCCNLVCVGGLSMLCVDLERL